MTDLRRIEELLAEAHYARERYDLYRAKMYGLRSDFHSSIQGTRTDAPRCRRTSASGAVRVPTA
jgi:hypothetical protein